MEGRIGINTVLAGAQADRVLPAKTGQVEAAAVGADGGVHHKLRQREGVLLKADGDRPEVPLGGQGGVGAVEQAVALARQRVVVGHATAGDGQGPAPHPATFGQEL